MKRKFGIRMDGCEEEFEQILKQTAAKFTPCNVLEIGTAGGTTLRAMWGILEECKPQQFRLIGSDLPNGWSLDKPSLDRLFGDELVLTGENFTSALAYKLGSVTLTLQDAKKFLATFESEKLPIHFCFIDGCHGAPCVKADFLAVEPHVPSGGVVVFHDIGEIEQGTDWQGHCGQYINVRQGVKELGLLDGSRPGWKVVKEIQGDRLRGGEGNNCFVVERV
jgi:hypothetical protein